MGTYDANAGNIPKSSFYSFALLLSCDWVKSTPFFRRAQAVNAAG